MNADFLTSIKQLTSEKALDEDVVFGAVERGMAAAVKRRYGMPGAVQVRIERSGGAMDVWSELEVVELEEDIADEDLQIELERAREIKPEAQIGEMLRADHEIEFEGVGGRIEAQTAKQVVLQALREAERDAVFAEFSGQEGGIVSGTVLRVDQGQVTVDLGRAQAIMPLSEQVRSERFRGEQRVKAVMVEVLKSAKGPQVVISRNRPELVRRLFELEVPEIGRGLVEIAAIAREPGQRTKVAVHARQEGLDPVGACVGMRAARIQNVVNELDGERVDVIQWDPDPRRYVEHALSPAHVLAVRIDPETNTAEVAVPDPQLSLAIGREGQNARLAARLTNLRIDIKPQTVAERLRAEDRGAFAPQPELEIEPEAPVAPAQPAVAVAEPEAAPVPVPAAAPQADRPAAVEGAEPEAEEELEPEPVAAAAELAADSRPGQIRFGEDVLRREIEEPRRQRRRPRYYEVEEGLEDDPYAEYEDEF